MHKIKKISLIILVSLLIVIAGCSECKTDSDCGKCKTCNEGKCATQYNCCGNGIVESGETCSTCVSDAGCKLKEKCISDICTEESSAVTNTLSFDKKASYFDFKTTLSYDNPFNTKKSTFDTEIQLTGKKQNIDYLKINTIEIKTKVNNIDQTIGKLDVNKYLYEINDKILDSVNIDYDFSQRMVAKSITIIIYYEYLNKKSDGSVDKKSESYSKSLQTSLSLSTPSSNLPCTPSTDCNDGNACTNDFCITGTQLCEYQRKSSCCGNFECESNENKATCPQDCGACERDNDEYTYYTSYKNDCILKIKENVQNPVVVTKSVSVADAKISVKNSYNNPFNTDKDIFTIDVTLDDATEQLLFPFKITKLQMIYKSIVVAEDSTSLKIVAAGRTVASTLSVLSPPMDTYRNELEPTLRISYEYDQKKSSGDIDVKRGSYDLTFGQQITFINP